jgi:hypothetical protein
MPKLRHRGLRERGWTNSHRNQLKHGHDFFHDAWSDAHQEEREGRDNWPDAETLADMEAVWKFFREELLAEYADKIERPWAWWRFEFEYDKSTLPFDFDELDWRDRESAALDHFGLLTPAALAAAAKDSHITRGILNDCHEPAFRRCWGWWRFTSPERRDYSKPEAVQLVELERRGAEILTDRERYVIKHKADVPAYATGCAAKMYLSAAEVAALGLPAKFICPWQEDADA